MLSNAVNQNQIYIFSGCRDLDFNVGKIRFMVFSFIEYAGFDFAFSTVTKFSGRSPLVVIKKLSFGCKTDNVFLS